MYCKLVMNQRLTKRWGELFSSSLDENNLNAALDDIAKKYSEKHRHYHTLAHIEDCLNQFDEVREQLTNPIAVGLAILFHDAIYDPKASDNEYQSSIYASEVLGNLQLGAGLIEIVSNLVMLTKHDAQPTTTDETLLIDIDLSILGRESSEYKNYAKAIRQEYRHVPHFLYKHGRRKVLKKFLDRIRIFNSNLYFGRFEEQARRNLQNELDTL